jgi:hypothetical protein
VTSQKLLNSVAHNIAHHAVSGLSYVHPHLKQAVETQGLDSFSINLLCENPCPPSFRSIESLQLALLALKDKLGQIVSSEGLSVSDLHSADLLFEFPSNYPDDYCSDCHAVLVSVSGKTFRQSVNYLGQSIAPNLSFNPDPTVGR